MIDLKIFLDCSTDFEFSSFREKFSRFSSLSISLIGTEISSICECAMGPKVAAEKKEGIVKEGKESKPLPKNSRTEMDPVQDRILVETMLKEESCRDRFFDNAIYYRKARNPCNGELTARDNADFLIPIEHTIKTNFETEKFLNFDRTYQQTKQLSQPEVKESLRTVKSLDVHKLEKVRGRKAEIDYELEQMRKVIEFKRQQLQSITK